MLGRLVSASVDAATVGGFRRSGQAAQEFTAGQCQQQAAASSAGKKDCLVRVMGSPSSVSDRRPYLVSARRLLGRSSRALSISVHPGVTCYQTTRSIAPPPPLAAWSP